MPRGDSVASATSDAPKEIGLAWRDAPNVLLLESPARFDRVEVGRVRRQVHDTHTVFGTCGRDPGVMMGAEVVHHDYVSTSKPRQQLGFHPCDEAVLVRGREHAREHHPPSQANGPKEGKVLAPVHRDPIDQFLAALHPRVATAHRQVHPRFVEEDEPARWDVPDLVQVGRALGDDVRPQTLQWPSAFFFTTYPYRRSARLMLETCTRSRRPRCRLNSAVSSPAVASRTFASAASMCSMVITDGVPPPRGVGATLPAWRCSRTQRFTEASPTWKLAATSG